MSEGSWVALASAIINGIVAIVVVITTHRGERQRAREAREAREAEAREERQHARNAIERETLEKLATELRYYIPAAAEAIRTKKYPEDSTDKAEEIRNISYRVRDERFRSEVGILLDLAIAKRRRWKEEYAQHYDAGDPVETDDLMARYYSVQEAIGRRIADLP